MTSELINLIKKEMIGVLFLEEILGAIFLSGQTPEMKLFFVFSSVNKFSATEEFFASYA